MENERYPLPDPLITVSPEWLSGEPIFTGRRVMIQTLFDYLADGCTVDEFLKDYPTVSREHAIAVIRKARQSVAPAIAAE